MSDFDNAMTARPRAALAQQVNAFRAGRAEAESIHGRAGLAGSRAGERPGGPSSAQAPRRDGSSPDAPFGTPWDEVREQVAALSPEARDVAARRAEILAVAGQGLAERPYAERKAILAHMASHLATLGVAGADGFDPTDANLSRAVGEAVILKGMLGGSPDGPGAPSASEPET